MNVKIQIIANSLRWQGTRNIKTKISIKFVEIDKALLRVSHENNRAGNYNFLANSPFSGLVQNCRAILAQILEFIKWILLSVFPNFNLIWAIKKAIYIKYQ